MRLARIALLALVCVSLSATAAGQRRTRARTPEPSPVDAQLFLGTAPHTLRLNVVARTDVDLTADVRLLHLEVRAPGARRGLACDSPIRPRRLDRSTVRPLRAGETWDATFDVRMVCWGRALAALEAGAEVGGTFGLARGRAGIAIARTTNGETRSAPIPVLAIPAVPAPPAPEGEVRISLAPADAANGTHLSFRVLVRATRSVRAWVRPDRVRFRVVAPDGTTRTCAISRGGSAAIPDLFARVGARSGPAFSLDARAYCGAHAFAAPGIYEVTPLLDLDVDGSEWRLDTPLGTFEGVPAPVRIRTGDAP